MIVLGMKFEKIFKIISLCFVTFMFGESIPWRVSRQQKMSMLFLISPVNTTQTSLGLAQVFGNLGLAHASVDAKNLGSV